MKLIKIEPDVNAKAIVFPDIGKKLLPVTLTFKKFWTGKEVQVKAFPTNHGPTYGTGKIQYFIYTNEVGEELDDEVCKKINNFLFTFLFNYE